MQKVRGVIDAIGVDQDSRYVLGYCGGFAADPQQIFTLRDGGRKPDALIVHVWPEGSRSTYYATSHSPKLTRIRGATRLLHVAEAELRSLGCVARDFGSEAGLALADGGL